MLEGRGLVKANLLKGRPKQYASVPDLHQKGHCDVVLPKTR